MPRFMSAYVPILILFPLLPLSRGIYERTSVPSFRFPTMRANELARSEILETLM